MLPHDTQIYVAGHHGLVLLASGLVQVVLVSSMHWGLVPGWMQGYWATREVTSYQFYLLAGMVIARQRPGTAKGTMFLLFEDEWGVINLIVPKAVYEARRALARAEPLLLARGRLERHESVTNVIVRELEPLERFLVAPGAGVA